MVVVFGYLYNKIVVRYKIAYNNQLNTNNRYENAML